MRRPHVWKKYRRLAWLVCRCCGLVWLKNDATERIVRAGCDGLEDP